MPVPSINLVVALPAEAKPIIFRFDLERVQPDLDFPLYRRGRIALVVTGPGKSAAAAGTAFLGTLDNRSQGGCCKNPSSAEGVAKGARHAVPLQLWRGNGTSQSPPDGLLRHPPQVAIWINFGIAGHAERQVGEVLLACSITDVGSGQVWHPILPQDRSCPADDLSTLDQPDPRYRHQGMVDMEASGFFSTACRYAGGGLVQVLKVISDNRETTARGLSAKQVRQLMGEALGTLEALLASLEGSLKSVEYRGVSGIPYLKTPQNDEVVKSSNLTMEQVATVSP